MSGSGTDVLRVENDGAVTTVTLDRPDRLNALSRPLLRALVEVVERCIASPDVRVLVIAGEGRMFSAGADIDEIAEDIAHPDADRAIADARLGERLCTALGRPELVTIAAVHGHAVGGAAAIVAACDLRVLAEGARIVVPELAMGVPLAWGGVERLTRDLGATVVRDLLLTGRPLHADEALARGFASEVVAADRLREHAGALAATIASRSEFAVTAILRRIDAITQRRDAAGMDDDAVTLAEAVTDPAVVEATREYLAAVAQRAPKKGRADDAS